MWHKKFRSYYLRLLLGFSDQSIQFSNDMDASQFIYFYCLLLNRVKIKPQRKGELPFVYLMMLLSTVEKQLLSKTFPFFFVQI